MRMRRFLILLGIIFFGFGYFIANAQAVEVNVRYSEGPEGKRIVFEAHDETFIKNSSVSILKDSIQVRFPSAPILRYSNNVNLDLTLQGNIANIRLMEPSRIKTLYLSAPPRISIDIFKTPQAETTLPVQRETKTPIISPIVIDPGHGGYDLGIIINEIREKDITLSIAIRLESALLKKNRPVFLTRKVDQFLSITDRAIVANQRHPGIFISLHLSLSEAFVINVPYIEPSGESAEGIFDMMYRQRRFIDRSKTLAEAVGKAIQEEAKIEVVYREIPISLLNSINAPAILIEFPRSVANDKERRTRLTQAFLRGIEYANQ